MHHRYFECNYAGTDAAFMDIFFGTFRASLGDNEADKDGPKARADAKSTLRTVPTAEFLAYLFGSVACCLAWYFQVGKPVSEFEALFFSALAGFGPVALAPLTSKLFSGFSSVKPVKMSNFGNALHIGTGTLFCSVPVTYGCYLALKNV